MSNAVNEIGSDDNGPSDPMRQLHIGDLKIPCQIASQQSLIPSLFTPKRTTSDRRAAITIEHRSHAFENPRWPIGDVRARVSRMNLNFKPERHV